jgi:hypothetical protein
MAGGVAQGFMSARDRQKYLAGDKMEITMHEWKHHQLHSGSKTGPKVRSRKQAIAIGISQAHKAGQGKK